MPNTKSAERRVRNSARKQLHNRSIKTRLHHLERNFAELLGTGKKEEAATALRNLSSAFDKAAKVGVVNRHMASRKKSRLSIRLKAVKAA
jgi:small subunit ribosomal protein S20